MVWADSSLYNPNEPQAHWEATDPFPNPCANFATCTLENGDVCSIGGTDGDNILDIVKGYNFTIREWYDITPVNQACTNSYVFALPGNGMLKFGGLTNQGYTNLGERYDPSTKEWNDISPYPLPIIEDAAACLESDLICLVGGFNDGHLPQSSTKVYNWKIDSWGPGADLNTPRAGHTATPCGNGILVAGGQGYQNAFLDSAEQHVRTPITPVYKLLLLREN